MADFNKCVLKKSRRLLCFLVLMFCVCAEVSENCGDGLPPVSQGCRDIGKCVHTWGDWSVTTAATCTAPGVETRTCTQDGSHTETQPIAKLSGSQCVTNPLVNGSNEAWINNYSIGNRNGFIFNLNGTYMAITDNSAAVWSSSESGEWSVSGPRLYLNGNSYTYSISGNTLYLFDVIDLTENNYIRTTGISIGSSAN
jgi:hypothetical protein